MSTRPALGRLPRGTRWLAALVAVELLAVGWYFALTPTTVSSPRYVVYPLLWIAAGAWAVIRTDPPPASRRARDGAKLLAGGYFVALAFLSGLLALYIAPAGAAGHSHSHIHGLRVTMATPGWGPRISYVTHLFHIYFVPFRVVGYLALAYLVYAAVLDAAGAAVPGVLGAATCIGCTFPLVASLAADLGGATVAAAAATYSLDVSTAAFLLALGLLYWRPVPGSGFGRSGGDDGDAAGAGESEGGERGEA